MKWTNPGHQLDELGKQYLKVKNIYIVGTDTVAKKAYDVLDWLGVSDEFEIHFVEDRLLNAYNAYLCIRSFLKSPSSGLLNIAQAKKELCGKPVISLRQLYSALRKDRESSAILLRTNHRAENLRRLGAMNVFRMGNSRNRRDNFIQNFLCVWLMYKHDKLMSHWTNFLTGLRCNLNCEGCLNFNKYLSTPRDVSFEEFKRHVDALFSKFNYLYSFHLCGGEPLLVGELPKFIRYIADHYRERIFEFFIITNSTIIPSEEVMESLKPLNGFFLLDDYSASAPNKIRKIEETLGKHNIAYTIGKPAYWYDLDIDNACVAEDVLESYKDDCNSFLHGFGEGRIYACCYQKYAQRAGLVEIDSTEYIEIADTTKMEILEFRQGYTTKGYVNMCKHCRGIGANAKKISPAAQISKAGTER